MKNKVIADKLDTTMKLPQNKVKFIKGTDGKIIQQIMDLSGAKIKIQHDNATIKGTRLSVLCAKTMLDAICERIKVGDTVVGWLSKQLDMAVFIDIDVFCESHDGFLHISRMDESQFAKLKQLPIGTLVEAVVVEIEGGWRYLLKLPETN